jgi:hypothetical protein
MKRFLQSIVGFHNDIISIYTYDINLQESQAEMKVKIEEIGKKQDEIKVK